MILALIAAACGTAGCQLLTAAAVATSEDPKEEVAAEFSKLAGKRAMVLVWAESDTLFEYPHVRMEVGAYLADHLKARIPDVRFIPARKVEEYIERLATYTQDPQDAGREFSVDLVIHITLLEFSMRDREMAQFYRGRVRASTAVYDMKDPSGQVQRYSLTDVFVQYPPDRPVGFDKTAATVVRQKTYEVLADAIGRKFYTWERPR